jgi:uncharacterized protein (DUF362 family)
MKDRTGTGQPPSSRGLSRRDFAKLGAAAALLARCGPSRQAAAPTAEPTARPAPSDTPLPPPTSRPVATTPATATPGATASPSPMAPLEETGVARLAFVKTRDRAAGVRQAVELLGLNPVQGKQVVLKPNLNSGDPAPAATHADTLRTLAEVLWEMGAQSITVGDRSGLGDTQRVMETLGIPQMAEELALETVCFDRLTEKRDWVKIEPPDSHWQQGFIVPRLCVEAEAVVQTCCLKTHRYASFTLSLKNAVGMVGRNDVDGQHGYMSELHSSRYIQEMIAEINLCYSPALVVMDGVEAFIDGGPERGKHAWGEVVLAGTDRVALDAVGLALLRHLGCRTAAAEGAILGRRQVARAMELGLGVDQVEKIQLVTGDAESEQYAAQIREILLGG